MRKSFVLHTKINELLQALTMEQRGKLFSAIMEYECTGEMPTIDDVCVTLAFIPVKQDLDATNASYDSKCAKNRENGKLGGRPKKPNGFEDNHVVILETEQKHNDNDNDNDKRKEINKEKKTTRFIKPTVADISEYCRERGNRVNPQRFYDYYESKGWLVGKSHMKDWKACVRTWEQRDKASPDKCGTQRDDDLDAMLIKQIISRGGTSEV